MKNECEHPIMGRCHDSITGYSAALPGPPFNAVVDLFGQRLFNALEDRGWVNSSVVLFQRRRDRRQNGPNVSCRKIALYKPFGEIIG